MEAEISHDQRAADGARCARCNERKDGPEAMDSPVGAVRDVPGESQMNR